MTLVTRPWAASTTAISRRAVSTSPADCTDVHHKIDFVSSLGNRILSFEYFDLSGGVTHGKEIAEPSFIRLLRRLWPLPRKPSARQRWRSDNPTL